MLLFGLVLIANNLPVMAQGKNSYIVVDYTTRKILAENNILTWVRIYKHQKGLKDKVISANK